MKSGKSSFFLKFGNINSGSACGDDVDTAPEDAFPCPVGRDNTGKKEEDAGPSSLRGELELRPDRNVGDPLARVAATEAGAI